MRYVELSANFWPFFTEQHSDDVVRHKTASCYFLISLADFERVFIPRFFPNMEKLKQAPMQDWYRVISQVEFERLINF